MPTSSTLVTFFQPSDMAQGLCSAQPLGLELTISDLYDYFFPSAFFFFFFFLVLVLVLVFQDRVSLYSRGCPGTHFVNQAGLELRSLPASASRVLGLKACATTPGSSAMSCPGDSSCFCSLSSVARREVRVQGGSLKRRNHC